MVAFEAIEQPEQWIFTALAKYAYDNHNAGLESATAGSAKAFHGSKVAS